ncbi:hypothetical protein [Maricaulis maris]|uniref:Uncharacterized protein n=1 Tax=Maricaulis maris TaxID=74318 RepID=A0A495D677_9PROT|nr:hypothetical protein [Maricaulis maris]RKQ96470.1 hypothetical protein C7435_1800 [Maricaulis maris]
MAVSKNFPGLDRLVDLAGIEATELPTQEFLHDWVSFAFALLTVSATLLSAFCGAWYAGKLNRKLAEEQHRRQLRDQSHEQAAQLISTFLAANNYLSSNASHVVLGNRLALEELAHQNRWSFVRSRITGSHSPGELPACCFALLIQSNEHDCLANISAFVEQTLLLEDALKKFEADREKFDLAVEQLRVSPLRVQAGKGITGDIAWSTEANPDVHRLALSLGQINSQILELLPEVLISSGRCHESLTSALARNALAWGFDTGVPIITLRPVRGDIFGDPAAMFGND